MNNVQDVLQLIMKTDVRLLACLAGLLIVLLFWRVFHRTSRIDREIARLNERFERIREEVRSLGRKPLLAAVPPAGAEHAAVGKAEENPVEEEPQAEESFFFSTDTRGVQASAGEEPDPFETESFSFSSEGAEEAEEMPEEFGYEGAADEPDQPDLSEEKADRKAWVKSSSLETTAGFEETSAEPARSEEESAEDSWMENFSAEPAAAESEETSASLGFEESVAESDQPEEESVEDSWRGTFSTEPAAAEPEEMPAEPVSEETSVAPEPSEEESAMDAWMKPAPAEEVPAESEEPPSGSGVIRLGGDPNRPDICLARCLACNYKLAYPGKLSGKRIRCPSCKSEHVLP